MSFERILIANRGEIACRIARTARRMGISVAAIYSEADEGAPHVRMADAAVCVGPPPSAESYLDIEAVVEAARSTGADAVHPGFGFLSENAEFVEALSAAGIAFIGPPPGAIRAMGDKIESRRLALDAGVNTVPGVDRALAGADEAVATAREIGYPVMLKASAGRRWQGDADRGRRTTRCARGSGARRARRSRASATGGSSSSDTWSARGTSRSRCLAIGTAPCSTSASASARCSAGTRR